MKRWTVFSLVVVFILGATGCSNESVDLNPKATESTIKSAPDWYTNPSDHIPEGSIGERATETSRDMMIADEKAQNAARGALRLQLEDIGETGNDRFVKETGLDGDSEIVKRFEGGNRSASASALKNSRVVKNQTRVEKGGIYRAYVLMIAPDPQLELLRQLARDKDIMEKFEQTEYFNDLSDRLDKYKERHTK
jgi:hypothetical protein